MASATQLQPALAATCDQRSFIQKLLIDALSWEIPEAAEQVEDIAYGWSQEDLRANELDKHLVEGSVWQLQKLSANHSMSRRSRRSSTRNTPWPSPKSRARSNPRPV